MAQIVNSNCISSGGLKQFGFINVPSGNWKLVTGSQKTFPGFSSNVIPICKNMSSSSNHGWYENTQIGFSGSTTVSINSNIAGTASASKGANVGSTQWSTSVNVYNIFIPMFYGMDLTLVQQKEKSGTITVWLEKK